MLLWLVSACGRPPALSVRVGTTKSEVNALIVIAQEHGYFSEHGLEVVHTLYPSGVAALDGLYAGEVDLATGSEFAFVGQVLDQKDVRALAVINRSAIEYLAARTDRGISTLADLRGKTIGVPLGSRPEFALDRFLYFRGIDPAEVALVDVRVDRSVEALVGGEVDAVAAWQPYIDAIRTSLGSGVVVWSVQEDQPSYTLLTARAGWTAGNQEAIARFLQALLQAESWVVAHPDAARAFVQEQWDYDAAYVASMWPDHTFAVLLDQTLVVVMEDQARWIIAREMAGRAETPNLVSYLYFEGLEAVKPTAVNVIR